MSSQRSYFRSFVGGEVTPEFWGQFGDAKFQTGLATCRNFTVLPHGPATNRPGFGFVAETKLVDSGLPVRLVPFEFSVEQTLVLEFGPAYVRFHSQGATVLKDGAPYEVTTPYQQGDLFDLHFVQSADVLTIVHPAHPPMELRRYGATTWALEGIDFVPEVLPPASATATATLASSPENTRTYRYKVTTKDADGEESSASGSASCTNNLLQTGAYNTITWPVAAGGSRYCVYCESNGLYGYIGETDALTFRDDNITPDLAKTPPVPSNPFEAAGGIASVPVTSGGSGYQTSVSGGIVTAVTVVGEVMELSDGGLVGFTTTPSLTVSDPDGSGAVLSTSWVYLGKKFSPSQRKYLRVWGLSVVVTSPGSGYTAPTVSIPSPLNGKAPGDLVIIGPESAEIKTSFSAFVSSPPLTGGTVTLTVTDSTGSGAVLLPVVTAGVITSVQVVNPGKGYTAPVVTITASGGGSGAVLGTPVLDSAKDYPAAVGYFEQRRVFAGTDRKPQTTWMTRTATESNLAASIPSRDDDAVVFRIAARQVNKIRHVVPLTHLLLLSSAAEWRVGTNDGSGAITPSTVSVLPQSYIGANNVQPVVVNNNVLFAAARGGHVRELAYNSDANGYLTGDICLRAPHLFDGKTVVDMAYTKAPVPTVWAVSSSGDLLGLTYVPEQNVAAWHHHDTGNGDQFASLCAVVEGNEDVLYACVRRMVGGHFRTYIERMASKTQDLYADSFLTYSGDPVITVSGLEHLEGREVCILGDGSVRPPQTVTDGEVALDDPASYIVVGLPIQADLQTLPLVLESVSAFGQGRPKNITQVWLRLAASSGIYAGPSFSKLVPFKQRTTEPMGSPPEKITGEIGISINPSWQNGGHVCIRQSDPLPLTVVSLAIEAEVAG